MNISGKQILDKLRAVGPDKALRIVMAAIVALMVVQGLRYVLAGPLARGFNSLAIEATDRTASARDVPKTGEEYRAVLDKGVLGAAPKKKESKAAPLYLFGVMGNKALLGSAASKAKPYAVGDEVQDGEILIEIAVREVVLEKDGEKRTIDVFDSPSEKPSKEKRTKPSSPEKAKSPSPPSAPPPGPPPERPPSRSRRGPPPGGIPPEAIEHLRAMKARGEEIPAQVLEQVEAAGITL